MQWAETGCGQMRLATSSTESRMIDMERDYIAIITNLHRTTVHLKLGRTPSKEGICGFFWKAFSNDQTGSTRVDEHAAAHQHMATKGCRGYALFIGRNRNALA